MQLHSLRDATSGQPLTGQSFKGPDEWVSGGQIEGVIWGPIRSYWETKGLPLCNSSTTRGFLCGACECILCLSWGSAPSLLALQVVAGIGLLSYRPPPRPAWYTLTLTQGLPELSQGSPLTLLSQHACCSASTPHLGMCYDTCQTLKIVLPKSWTWLEEKEEHLNLPPCPKGGKQTWKRKR